MRVCVDACFLVGLYDERDGHHAKAEELFLDLFDKPGPNIIVVVWPALYESVSTRLVKRHDQLSALEKDWRRLIAAERLQYLDDSFYRDDALEMCFTELQKTRHHYRSLSLTDRVLRAAISDTNARIDRFITFNVGDFEDVCRKGGCEIVN